jgi:ComF family protein
MGIAVFQPLRQLLQFFFPITCTACGVDLPADDIYRICDPCSEKIKFITGLYCQKCGVPLPFGGAHCYSCRKNGRLAYERIRSAAVYEGVLRDLVHKFKYMDRDYLDRLFGALLADTLTITPELGEVDAVVAVPAHWTRKLVRGYNQAELLAARVARSLEKPLAKGYLRRKKMTKAQYRLSRQERKDNLQGCFICDRELKGRTLLVVDDICTTGATIDACAAALRHAGAKKVYGLTLARDR